MVLTDGFVASALGVGNEETWKNYLAGTSPGMREISGDIPGRGIWFGCCPAKTTEPIRTNGLLRLAYEGLEPSVMRARSRYGAKRVAVVLGSSNAGTDEFERGLDAWLDTGNRPADCTAEWLEQGLASRFLRNLAGLEGPAYTISTACSSSTKAFGAAARLIRAGIVDAALVGGADGRCRVTMNGFHALGALASGQCRPFAADRDGINLGEGVGLFVMEREGAGVKFTGFGESSDAYHATAPDPSGAGAAEAMRQALVPDIDYINLHGTGTQANDDMELKALEAVFGAEPPFHESTKRLTGHCLGAAGAVEAAICYLRILHGKSRCALSANYAFGGSNAAITLSA